MLHNTSVEPSGGAFAANSVAMLPAAPGRFSTNTCTRQRSVSAAATMRAVVSTPPPGT
ncbi:hypothetical protein D3C83_297510 [compost metagenome]